MSIKNGYIHLDIKENRTPSLDIEADSMEEIVVMIALIIEKFGDQFKDDPDSLKTYQMYMQGAVNELTEEREDENY